ncbi:MAG: molybdopterin converting factor subunit 1 [Vicinamibacterales bacterium]
MLVTVRLFARLRDLAGRGELSQVLPDDATVGHAWDAMVAECPALAAYGSSLSAAVNADYARFTEKLKDGDEVAFLPPVSGG